MVYKAIQLWFNVVQNHINVEKNTIIEPSYELTWLASRLLNTKNVKVITTLTFNSTRIGPRSQFTFLLLFGSDGKWSWEETVYAKLSGKIGAHLDNTKFWDMGTPERLSKLTEFLKSKGA